MKSKYHSNIFIEYVFKMELWNKLVNNMDIERDESLTFNLPDRDIKDVTADRWGDSHITKTLPRNNHRCD